MPVSGSLVSNCNQGESQSMSIESHLTELERRHQALEREIESEQTHAACNDLKVTELKRKKLMLKEEIARLRSGIAETVH
jgi:hypothetical protein